MTNPKVRYIIAWHAAKDTPLVGLWGARPFCEGWYRTIYDDDGRAAFHGGPYPTAEEAMRLPDEPSEGAMLHDTDCAHERFEETPDGQRCAACGLSAEEYQRRQVSRGAPTND